MKKGLAIVAVCLIMAMNLNGCGGGGGSSNTSTGTDSITIANISPTSAVAGTSTTFLVDVSYTLASKNGGALAVGFNTDPAQPDSFYLDPTQEFLVTKGSGTHTFTSKATPVAGKFMVSVYLSENPHPTPWTPLASDRRTIPPPASLVSPLGVVADVVKSADSHIQCNGGVETQGQTATYCY